jgi:hypothetical protein
LISAGKACKIYGWDANERISLFPGYHELMLPWDPHLVWAGIAENAHHIPDNINIGKGTGF